MSHEPVAEPRPRPNDPARTPGGGRTRLNVRRWLPPLLWAGLILVLTSIPHPPGPSLFNQADKVAHFTLYAGLGFLLVRSLRLEYQPVAAIALAVAVCGFFGAVDEWHQQFIPGRSMELADWVADTLGGATGGLAAVIFLRWRQPVSQT